MNCFPGTHWPSNTMHAMVCIFQETVLILIYFLHITCRNWKERNLALIMFPGTLVGIFIFYLTKTKLVYHHHQFHLILAQDHTVTESDCQGGVIGPRFNFKYDFFHTFCSMIPYSLDYTLKVAKNNGSCPKVLLRITPRTFSKYIY